MISCDKYRKVESIDLSGENISGISLLDKYDEKEIEKIFGKVHKRIEEGKLCTYEYATQQIIVSLKVDKDNNIISIFSELGDNTPKTKNGLTKDSSFSYIKKIYGDSFLKKEYRDFMGSGDGYFITYVDKVNKVQIQFGFSKLDNKETLSGIKLSKY
jgi:hypothetical protein